MASEFNGSSYYRANPYYQQGYIPDGALKNRKPPYQMGEIPQGEEFFQPTNKKHFQRLGYYSTIAQQNIIHSKEPNSVNFPAKDKEYFRSLNINDIQGATTNTLISKGVKNRLKAQEELHKRALQQKEAEDYEKMRRLQRMEDDRKRTEALNILKKNSQPNYHEIVKRMRTEEKEKMAANMEQTPTKARNDHYQPPPNNNSTNRDSIRGYHQQLEQTQREIKQLELQLSQVQIQKEKAKQDYQERIRSQSPSNREDPSVSIAPVTNQIQNERYRQPQTYQPYQHQQYAQQQTYQENPQQLYNNSSSYKYQLSPEEAQYLAKERQRQEKAHLNYNQQQNSGVYKEPQQTQQRMMSPIDSRGQRNPSSLQPLTGRENRQQHRRFNPTFLSYGSPSIGLAGKNIVGY